MALFRQVSSQSSVSLPVYLSALTAKDVQGRRCDHLVSPCGLRYRMGRSIRYRTHDSFDDQAGVAAVHIEDQVGTKRCGRRPGKELVPTGEMVDRIKAGCGRSLAIDRAIWNLRCICLEGSMPTRQQGRNHMRVKLCVMTTAAFAFAEQVHVRRASEDRLGPKRELRPI